MMGLKEHDLRIFLKAILMPGAARFTPLYSEGLFIWGGIQYLKGIENLEVGHCIGGEVRPECDFRDVRLKMSLF